MELMANRCEMGSKGEINLWSLKNRWSNCEPSQVGMQQRALGKDRVTIYILMAFSFRPATRGALVPLNRSFSGSLRPLEGARREDTGRPHKTCKHFHSLASCWWLFRH